MGKFTAWQRSVGGKIKEFMSTRSLALSSQYQKETLKKEKYIKANMESGLGILI